MPRDWDANAYDELPIPMTGWGRAVVDRVACVGELDVESRNPRWNRDHRIQVELGHLGAFLCEPGNPE